MVSLKSWAETDIGRRRANNEDFYYHDHSLGLFMVADGMGGHKGGDQASKIAVETATQIYRAKIAEDVPADQALKMCFSEAAKMVHEQSLLHPELRGMGTTLSSLAIKDENLFIAHIGDSRIYRFRNQTLHQLTCDHSLVNEQVQAGLMSAEEARLSSLRNIITRAIGHDENVNADYLTYSPRINDIYLLCTDGLNNMLLDSEIVSILSRFEPKKAIKQLILEANRLGGEDNITVILIKICS